MKKIKTYKCTFCDEDFVPTHGNNKTYCQKGECKKKGKSEKQNRKYPIGNDAKHAIKLNHKLFSQILPDERQGEFDLLEVVNLGFNEDGYFQTFSQKGKILYKVHDYYFAITNTTPKKIQIWKA